MSDMLQVCAAVVFHCDKLLLATRPANSDLAGCWEFPGGKKEDNETLADCIKRELFEELSLTVKQASLVFELEYKYPTKKIKLFFMYCEVADSELLPQEGQSAGWFSAENLPRKSMAAAYKKALQCIIEGKWRTEIKEQADPEMLPVIRNLSLTEKIRNWLRNYE
jgi:mutator protein MutT